MAMCIFLFLPNTTKCNLFLHLVYEWVTLTVVKKVLRGDDGGSKRMLAPPALLLKALFGDRAEKMGFTESRAELKDPAVQKNGWPEGKGGEGR